MGVRRGGDGQLLLAQSQLFCITEFAKQNIRIVPTFSLQFGTIGVKRQKLLKKVPVAYNNIALPTKFSNYICYFIQKYLLLA
jgi:hypothetical protein